MKLQKRRRANNNYDPNNISNNSYNDGAGAQKNLPVGPYLKPIQTGAATYITDISAAAVRVGKGVSLSIFNNTATVQSVTIGGSTVASLAAGIVDANGKVGIALKAYEWTHVNTYDNDYIISSANTVICYVVEDDTYIEIKKLN